MGAADLPAAENSAGHSVIEVPLPRPSWKFVQIADDKGVRYVLIADSFLALQVIRVLCPENVRIEPGKG